MRHFSMSPLAPVNGTSTSTSNVVTLTLPQGTSAVWMTAETTSARVTLDGSDPSAANAPSSIIQTGQNPVLLPISHDAIVKFVSTANANSVLQVAPFE